jgi:hypothetical protein
MADDLDARLDARLVDLGSAIAWPAGADLAMRVGDRIRAGEGRRRTGWWPQGTARPVRRGLVLALAALLLLGAAVAAVGIILPGLRIVFVPPGATLGPSAPSAPAASESAPGWSLSLGAAVELEDAAASVGFEPLLPAGVGEPDGVHVANERLTLVWRSGDDLPRTDAAEVGLLLTELRGRVDPGYYEKQLHEGRTTVERVDVGGSAGYWLSGEPHGLVYRRADGSFVEESRRIVGDVLIWQQDDLTLRLESALGREATIALARTVSPGR